MIGHPVTEGMRISKSKFVAGVQCLKRLYFQVHQPELAVELDEATKAVIAQGHQVGLEAQKAFPGGVTVDAGREELDKAIKTTRELVAKSEVPAIFEATFQHEGVLVRTDILKRSGRSGHRLIEVKSSTKVKPHYAYDIAIQRHVLSGADIEVKQASLLWRSGFNRAILQPVVNMSRENHKHGISDLASRLTENVHLKRLRSQ
jgi:hypothetical protein